MKTIVFATKSSSFKDLKVEIFNVILGITINQLTNRLHDRKIILPFVLQMIEDV